MKFDIEVTKERMGDGDEIVNLIVTLGDTKRWISMDLGQDVTPQQVAAALRTLAMTIDPPDMPAPDDFSWRRRSA